MKKIAILLIICLAITALAGCARADGGKEEFATLSQPEQTIQKDEVAEKEEPADIDSEDESEEETNVPEQPQSQQQPKPQEQSKEELEEVDTETPQSSEEYATVYASVPEGAKYELFTLPKIAGDCVGWVNYSGTPLTFQRMQERLDPSRSIVIRGKINGKSTQYHGDRGEYNETPILVQEVYYGNAKVGDTILCLEEMFVHLHDGKEVLDYHANRPPLEKDEEYLFIFYGSKVMHEGGGEVYFPGHSNYPYIKISDLKWMQEKSELTFRHQRNLDALTYYYLGQRGEETE